MKIDRKPSDVSLTLSPSQYWLRENKGDLSLGKYALTHRIDMSYAGKPDQEGPVAMFLSELEVIEFKNAGFDEITGGFDPTVFIGDSNLSSLLGEVTRVEVIDFTKSVEDGGGRLFTYWKPEDLEASISGSLQDDLKTLKIFINNK